jgi:hypothetical protein
MLSEVTTEALSVPDEADHPVPVADVGLFGALSAAMVSLRIAQPVV